MRLTLKQSLFLSLAFVMTLLLGLTAGFVMGAASKDNFDWLSDLFAPKEVYQSSCTITVTRDDVPEDIFVGNAAQTPELPQSVFQVENYYAKIAEQYPNAEYHLSIEQNFTYITITVQGEHKEYLYEICQLALELFGEEVISSTDGVSCKILTSISHPELIHEAK